MFSIDQLATIVWKRKVTFLLTFVAVLLAAALITALLPKVYRTGAYLYVSAGRQATSDFEQVQTNQVVTKTIAELLQTRNVADEVAEALPFEASGRALQTTVEIQPITQSQLITVTAEASSAERAQLIANTYARTFIDRFIPRTGDAAGRAETRLAVPAPLIPAQARPRPRLYMLMGAIVAAFAALGAALLRHRTDQRLEIDSTSTDVLGLSIIGRVTSASQTDVNALVGGGDDDGRLSRGLGEEYRLILANLAFVNKGHRPRTLAVVSAGQGEGKSTTCLSLGRAASEVEVRTLVVDGDLRRPGLTAMTDAGATSRGLSSFLVDLEPLALSDVAVEVGGPDLSVVPSGPIPPNPAALMGSAALGEFVERSAKVFDLVIFDTPPLSIGADASLVSSHVEGVILVVDARKTRRTALLQSVEQLKRAQANILGVVINRVSDSVESSYYYAPAAPQPRGKLRRRGALSALASADRDDE